MADCKVIIPGLDRCKCVNCGWVATNWGISFLERSIKGKKEDSEASKQLSREKLKKNNCKALSS